MSGKAAPACNGEERCRAKDAFCITSAGHWLQSWSLLKCRTQCRNAMTLSSLWGAEEDCGITKGFVAKQVNTTSVFQKMLICKTFKTTSPGPEPVLGIACTQPLSLRVAKSVCQSAFSQKDWTLWKTEREHIIKYFYLKIWKKTPCFFIILLNQLFQVSMM